MAGARAAATCSVECAAGVTRRAVAWHPAQSDLHPERDDDEDRGPEREDGKDSHGDLHSASTQRCGLALKSSRQRGQRKRPSWYWTCSFHRERSRDPIWAIRAPARRTKEEIARRTVRSSDSAATRREERDSKEPAPEPGGVGSGPDAAASRGTGAGRIAEGAEPAVDGIRFVTMRRSPRSSRSRPGAARPRQTSRSPGRAPRPSAPSDRSPATRRARRARPSSGGR